MLKRSASGIFVLAQLLFGQDKPALTVDQIVQKHLQALGGLDKVKAITTLVAIGHASMPAGQQTPTVMKMKRPSSMRVEMGPPARKVIQAYDGTTAWMVNPMAGGGLPQKASPETTLEMRDSADIDFTSLADYKAKGSTVELMGMEDVEGSPAYKLKVTKKNGRILYDYLDSKTFLPVKTSTKRTQMGTQIVVDAYPSNYKAVNGVLFPYTVDQKSDGKLLVQLTMDKVEANVPIDDAEFHMPQIPQKPKEEPARLPAPSK